jgi:hypothetical protein
MCSAAAIARALRPGGVALISDPCRAPFEELGESLHFGHGLRVRMRPFKTDRLASLPTNEDAASHQGFVQQWGRQQGQLFVVEKPGDVPDDDDASADAMDEADKASAASGTGWSGDFLSAEGLAELRGVVSAAVDECCDPRADDEDYDWQAE